MSLHQAIHLLKSLPAELQTEVYHFMETLVRRQQPATSKQGAGKNPPSLAERRRANRGRSRGAIEILPGFDDPVEGFEEYEA